MIIWLWIGLLWAGPWDALGRITLRNRTGKEAAAAYRARDFRGAADRYVRLLALSRPDEPAVLLNLGHALFRQGQYRQAAPYYQQCLNQTPNATWAATAATQLGLIACASQDSARALAYWQQALLLNADNEPARYNYEFIKRRWSGKTKPASKTKRSSATQQQETPTSAQDVAKSEEQRDVLQRQRGQELSDEQALQLLDALRSDDLPYSLIHRQRPKSQPIDPTNRW